MPGAAPKWRTVSSRVWPTEWKRKTPASPEGAKENRRNELCPFAFWPERGRIAAGGFRVVASFDRITTDPARLNGEPCIRNLRLPVRRVLEAVATYPDRNELKREYPELEDEDIRQALAFAATYLDDKILPPVITH